MNGFGTLILVFVVGGAVYVWRQRRSITAGPSREGGRRWFALPAFAGSFGALRELRRAGHSDAGQNLAQMGCEAILEHVEVVCGTPIYPDLHLYLQAPERVAAALENPMHMETLMDALACLLQDEVQRCYGNRAGGEVQFDYGGYVVERPVRVGPNVAAVASPHPLADPFGARRTRRPTHSHAGRSFAASNSDELTVPIPTDGSAPRRGVATHEVPATQMPESKEQLELALNVVGHDRFTVTAMGRITVGRMPDSMLVLPELEGLSRHHLTIIPRGEGVVTVQDTSTYGVYYEGHRLGESTELFLPISLALDPQGVCRLDVTASALVPTT